MSNTHSRCSRWHLAQGGVSVKMHLTFRARHETQATYVRVVRCRFDEGSSCDGDVAVAIADMSLPRRPLRAARTATKPSGRKGFHRDPERGRRLRYESGFVVYITCTYHLPFMCLWIMANPPVCWGWAGTQAKAMSCTRTSSMRIACAACYC